MLQGFCPVKRKGEKAGRTAERAADGDRTSDGLADPGQVGPGAGFQVIHMWVHRLSICGLFGEKL